ncbi:retron Ec67 family RNA-directed DNA polymerase/endonuclease [Planococcus rifietoensis]|uniref:retron Ec67 family RNA-directed DNA polymerase/endonuclease n=1 Tax=Planococcus rifietoensis TaxID=200991 RepID=UPI00384D82B9
MRKFNEIKTRNELADFLNIPRKQLSYILYVKGTDNSYTSFAIQKKNGGTRNIYSPIKNLKIIQKRLAKALIDHKEELKNKENNISHAFEKNKGIVTNAKVHKNKNFVFNIDLLNFFESIHFGRVRGFFRNNNKFLFPSEVATVIAQLTCYKGALPQGAPSSPIITNLICEILDYRISKITYKYKLDYTRYADDLTFSTNNKKFINQKDEFLKEITSEINKAGFEINDKKTRLEYKDSRQTVTGLVVNEKVNVNRIFYKSTKSMVHRLYKGKSIEINGEEATINQLEGRLSFINQLTKYNNQISSKDLHFTNLSSVEKQYQKFLIFKYFFEPSNPLIVTEGKTDVAYLKAALKNLYKEYPKLVVLNENGDFEFKVSFLKKTNRLRYFLGIYKDGGSALNNIYNFYNKKHTLGAYLSIYKNSGNSHTNPVMLLFDNEIGGNRDKPIKKFINYAKLQSREESLKKNKKLNISDNLFLLVTPLVGNKLECDMEDLFDIETLNHKIGGKKFKKEENFNTSDFYGKEIFSQYILKNYKNINFENFKPLLNNINSIVSSYESSW